MEGVDEDVNQDENLVGQNDVNDPVQGIENDLRQKVLQIFFFFDGREQELMVVLSAILQRKSSPGNNFKGS
jgi:hypothetical protein